MGRKKKMTPAQKAAARRTSTATAKAIEAAEAPAEPAPARPEQTPPSPSARNVLVGAAGIALVAVAGYFSTAGLG